MVACSLQKSALEALHTIYSSELNPVKWSKTSDLETMLQWELLEIINRPYGIHSENKSIVAGVKGANSPLWELHDLALKLTSIFIDCDVVSNEIPDVEDHLTVLTKLICSHQLEGNMYTRTTMRLTLFAHCLLKLFRKNGYEENSKRKLLSCDFICNCLFPLACKFAAAEYPATIVDPIGHYELFESTGKLKEPDEALVEWNRRNARKNVSGLDHDGYHAHQLPPTHVCLMYLIYELVRSSRGKDQNILVNFLEQKILVYDTNYDSGNMGANCKASKLALMNRIVALSVLGRTRLQLSSDNKISFLNELVFLNLEQDCLLMKICKFQLIRRLTIAEARTKISRAYLTEFIKIKDIGDFRGKRHKLFVIFAAVASECLLYIHKAQWRNLLTGTYLAPLDRESQLILVKQIIILYFDYKIISPLRLLSMVRCANANDESFTSECDRHLTKVIDSLESQLIMLLSARDTPEKIDRLHEIFECTFSLAASRNQPLPDKTVRKFLKVAAICASSSSFDGDRDPSTLKTLVHSRSNLRCALRFPLTKQAQVSAIILMDRIIEEFLTHKKSRNLPFFLIILGNLASFQAMNSPAIRGEGVENCNLLFKSTERIEKIYLTCKSMENLADATSICLSMLMSWPSSPVPLEENIICSTIWRRFVELTIIRLKESQNESFGEMRQNLVFALMAAYNQEQVQLEAHLIRLERPPNKSGSVIKKYIKFWLDFVTKRNEILWLRTKEIILRLDLKYKSATRLWSTFTGRTIMASCLSHSRG